MANTIGGERKRLNCQNCGEPYGWSEFSDYMLTLRSSTIDCFTCPAENYVVPDKSGQYRLVKLFCYMVSAALFILPFLAVQKIWISHNAIGLKTSAIIIGLGLSFAIAMHHIIMKIYNWKTGSLSLDKTLKSAADYDHY